MTTDAHYLIGHSHKVCQDYALASDDTIIVCDGCSSSPHTDMGARLVAWQVANHAHKSLLFEDSGAFPFLLTGISRHRFPGVSLDATLLVANRSGKVLVFGDGYVAGRKRDTGGWDISKVEFPSNAPAYPSYGTHLDRALQYIESGWGAYEVLFRQEDGWIVTEGGEGIVQEEDGFPLISGVRLDADPALYDMVVLMTDGIGSFTHRPEGARYPQALNDITILNEVLDFNGTKGDFVTRRLNSFLKRTAAKRGWVNQDDVGMAAIMLDDPDEES